MKVYLTIGSVPELRGLPTEDQTRLFVAARKRARRELRSKYWASFIALIGGTTILVGLLSLRYGGGPLFAMAGAGLGGLAFGQLEVSWIRSRLGEAKPITLFAE